MYYTTVFWDFRKTLRHLSTPAYFSKSRWFFQGNWPAFVKHISHLKQTFSWDINALQLDNTISHLYSCRMLPNVTNGCFQILANNSKTFLIRFPEMLYKKWNIEKFVIGFILTIAIVETLSYDLSVSLFTNYRQLT